LIRTEAGASGGGLKSQTGGGIARKGEEGRDPPSQNNRYQGEHQELQFRGPDPSLQTKRKAHLILLLARHGLNRSKYVYKFFGE